MIRVELTGAQRDELRARSHERGIAPRTRDRLEMIRLADAGWTIPRIAVHLGAHEQTVRKYVKAFLADGFAALPDRPRPGRPPTVTEAHLRRAGGPARCRAGGPGRRRNWPPGWTGNTGSGSTPTTSAVLLHGRRLGWQAHRDVGGPQAARPRWVRRQGRRTDDAQKKAEDGVIDLFFLDQSGFAPTLPTGYTWGRRGHRVVVPYEAPQGRRVNVGRGAFAPYDPSRATTALRRPGAKRTAPTTRRPTWPSSARFAGLPPDPARPGRRDRPCVVVLDNYSVHHSRAVKDGIPALTDADVNFCYLPPYSPELNPIEPVWRQIKYQDIPERSHKTDTALQLAVEAALTDRARRLVQSTNKLPRRA